MNGGVCHNTPTETGTSPGYACQCPLGYSGYHCENSNQDCRVHHCGGNGICQVSDDLIGSRRISVARPTPVGGNFNFKISFFQANGKCACLDGYYGANCQFNQTECWQNPCQGEKSICKPLEERTTLKPSQGPANIINFRCECQSGLRGVNCEQKVKQCDKRPCMHGKIDFNYFFCVTG